jgi:phosphomannomutase
MTPVSIKFGTDGWRAVIAREFTFDNLSRVTEATARWLLNRHASPQVMLGYDCRFNGRLFAEAVATQLAEHGIKVFISPGFVSTPMVSLATLQRQAHLGIVITASHNPPEYTGFKLKGAYGGPASPQTIAEVEALIPEQPIPLQTHFDTQLRARQIEYFDMEALYLNHVRQAFPLDRIRATGIKVGYDAMYGAGQRILPKILPEASLLHATFNPSFEGTAPEPIEKNLKAFEALIREQGLAFGLATDGDADRIGLYDENSRFVDSHHILLLLILYLVEYRKMKGKVVYTFSCTDKIGELCKYYGLESEVTKIGFKYIGEIMVREHVLVGGEESGGIAVAGHAPERDGIYIGLTVLALMAETGKSLTQLIEEVYTRVGRFSVQREDLHLDETQKTRILANVREGRYTQFDDLVIESTETLDGFKFRFQAGGWVMIRPSGTEPVLRIYAEAETEAAARETLRKTIQTIL